MSNFIKSCCEFLWIFMCVQQCISGNDGPPDLCEVGGVSGTCVVLTSCTQYETLIKSSETFLEGLQITQARQCGFEGSNMKVCCPFDTSVPDTSPSPDKLPDESDFVTDFPKPGECGKTFEEKYFEHQLGGIWSFKTDPTYGPPTTPISGGVPVGYDFQDPWSYPIPSGNGPKLPTMRGDLTVKFKDGPSYGYLPPPPPSIKYLPIIAGGLPVEDSNPPEYVPTPPPPPLNCTHEVPATGVGFTNDSGTTYTTRPMYLPTPVSGGYPVDENGWNFKPPPSLPPPTYPARPISGGFPVDANGTRYPQVASYPTPVSGGLPVVLEEPIPISGGYPVDEKGPKVGVSGGLRVQSRDYALWMALLGYKGADVFWQCGGTVITPRHVLTAAHCIKRSLYLVRLGEIDLAKTEKDYTPIDILVRKAIPHEDYTKFHNDIAIVVLEDRIDFASHNHITPICLPYSPTDPAVEGLRRAQKGVITGWGETETPGDRPTNLLYAPVDIQDREACAAAYPRERVHIDERVLCAGDRTNRRDACNGDSGGPLITMLDAPTSKKFAYYQLGIVSFGFPCKQERYSGVYTNVTHYMPWIEEKVLGKTRHWGKGSSPTQGQNLAKYSEGGARGRCSNRT